MANEELRRRRVARMVGLARVYRGWSATELGEALGRTATKAAPRSGNPKLDLVARLAQALDWDLGPVAESLWEIDPSIEFDAALVVEPAERCARVVLLDQDAQRLHRAGEFESMADVAREMRAFASSAAERAAAANRLAGAFDGLGRFPKVLAAVQEGLAEQGIGRDLRTMLTVNLANAHYTLWNLHEARAVAASVLERAAIAPAGFRASRIGRVAEAFAHSIRGHAQRRLLSQCECEAELVHVARAAEADLALAERLFDALHVEFDDAQYAGLARTAGGGAIEARVAAGVLRPRAAIERIADALDGSVDLAAVPDHNRIESWGWWSIFGANIAMRAGGDADGRVREASEYERAIAIFTNKASEIAEHLGNWPIHERSFTLEWFRRQRATGRGEEMPAWTLDGDDLRVLVGTMGRFPMFRAVGFRILEMANIDDDAWREACDAGEP